MDKGKQQEKEGNITSSIKKERVILTYALRIHIN